MFSSCGFVCAVSGCSPNLDALAISGGTSAAGCQSTANGDSDHDGFSPETGDCNDCATDVNPAAFDVPGNGIDEDCSGVADDEPGSCDSGLDLTAPDANVAAAALGLCRHVQGASWGLISASYIRADGTGPVQSIGYGALTDFGPNVQPRAGASMLALSSGSARDENDPGYRNRYTDNYGDTSGAPPGFTLLPPACELVGPVAGPAAIARDSAGVELVIHTPSNARALSFDFSFYTADYPTLVCAPAADVFAVYLEPAPLGNIAGNVVFDGAGNPISVDNSLIRSCTPPQTQAERAAVRLGSPFFECPLGVAALAGTGYETGAATGWLTTRLPVPADQQIRLRFVIWDAENFANDSTVLIDNLSWDVQAAPAAPLTLPAE